MFQCWRRATQFAFFFFVNFTGEMGVKSRFYCRCVRIIVVSVNLPCLASAHNYFPLLLFMFLLSVFLLDGEELVSSNNFDVCTLQD